MNCSSECKNLQYAVIYCCVPCVHQFISEVHKTDYYGQTALYHAVNKDCLAILFEHKADVNHKDYRGQSPFLCTVNEYLRCPNYLYRSIYLDKMVILLTQGAEVGDITTSDLNVRHIIETYDIPDIKEPDSN